MTREEASKVIKDGIEDDYVDAVIKVRVPKWQIGQEVNIYFKDSMYMKGIVDNDKETRRIKNN